MATSPDKGRAAITESLQAIAEVYKHAPMSVALSMFRDAKLGEFCQSLLQGTPVGAGKGLRIVAVPNLSHRYGAA